MGLMTTLKNMFRASVDDADEALKDPVRDAKYAIKDSEAEVSKFTAAVTKAMAANEIMKKERDNAIAEAKKYDAFALKADEMGNETDAEAACERAALASARADSLSVQIEKNEASIRSNRRQVDAIRAKIAKAKNDQARLSANLEAAKSRQALASASSTFNTASNNPLAALDNLEKAVTAAEAEASAVEELGTEPGGDLEAKYGATATGGADRLAALRAARDAKAKSGKKK